MNEVELKLDVTQAAVDAIVASGLLRGDVKSSQLRAVYHDTPDHALARADLSLRIRSAGGERIQTVKAGASAAGLFVRSKWERPVEGDTPIIDATTPVQALLGARASKIAPVFQVNVKRRAWTLRENGAVIEAVVDRGEVKAGRRRQPLCEIELELKSGQPAPLFAVARALDAIAPVRLGVRTKAERGYLLTKRTPTVFKAEPIAFDRDVSALQAFQHIARACIRHFRLNESVSSGARGADALHQARVGLRRLRSAFSTFKPLFGDDERCAAIRDELRWLASELGEARNLDVLIKRSRPGALRGRLQLARDAAYARVEAVLASRRTRLLMLDVAEWLTDGDWLRSSANEKQRTTAARDFAAVALKRLRGKVKRDGRDLEAADEEARHEVRKEAKKLRYAAEFFATLFEEGREPRRYRRFVAALEELQDQLGALNDLATAPEVIRKLGVGDDPEAARLIADGKKKALIKSAADAHHALVNAKRFWI